MLMNAIQRSFSTLFSPSFLALVIKMSLLTAIIFSLFIIGVVAFIINMNLFAGWDYVWLANIGMGVLGFIIAWYLIPSLIPSIGAFFQESIADTIERVEYPAYVPPAVERPLPREIWEAVKFIMLLIFLNILILPTLLLGIGFIAYFMLNSYLIGREFFETAAARHLGMPAAKLLRKKHRLSVFLGGSAVLGLSLVPLVNLISPFIGVALMVHLFHQLDKKVEILPPLRA